MNFYCCLCILELGLRNDGHSLFGWCSLQVPELFGPIRTIAEGRGETVLIGTTKNFVLQGSLDGEFIPITQVQTHQNHVNGCFSETLFKVANCH